MKKIIVAALSFFLTYAAAETYSNLIVFGDSQSDIGNMPESSNAGFNKPFYYEGIPYNLYVPFSNPMYGDQDNATDILFKNLFNAADLPAQPLINQHIRAGRSVNWSQYLFVNLRATEQLKSVKFIPWVELYEHNDSASQNLSANYAFAGALSDNHCADEGYQTMDDAFCTQSAIFNTQNIYRTHANEDDLRRAVAIPGIQRQIELFNEDLQAKRVYADAHTLYIVWGGANDLSQSFKTLIHGGGVKNFYHSITESVPDLLAGNNDSAVTRLYNLGARNIVIVGQQNLGLAPEASILTGSDKSFLGRYMNAYLLNFLVLRYNLALSEKIVALQKRYPDLHLTYVNLQWIINRLSLVPGAPFYKNIGLACQNQNAATYQSILRGDLVTCPNYLYWNRAHMTYQGNRVVAEQIKADLQ